MTPSDAFYIAWLLTHTCDPTCFGADHIKDLALLRRAIELRAEGRPASILTGGWEY